ncbi:MAG: M17 family peptidase N-terminal domain-containing protein, partial [Candidatus Glassbacteria bacterium]
MKLEIAGKLDLSVRQDALLVPVIQDCVSEDPLVAGLEGRLEGALGKLILQEEFKGKPGQVLSFNTLGRIGVETVCLMGLGPEQKLSAEAYRRAAGRAADCLRRMRAKKAVIACQVPAGKMVSAEDIAGGLVQGVWLGLYRFDKYKSRNDNGGEKYAGPDKAALFLCDSKGRPSKRSHPGLKEAAARELTIAEGVAGARDLVNEIPEELFPASLAKKAGELTGGIPGLTCRVLDEKQMKKEKMEAALAVGRGSGHGPRFIEIVYEPAGKVRGDGLLVLVGKGVTFDSGGLNIKPGEHMVTMKMDMSGAAVVINAIALIARLRLPVRCAAVVAAVENMPSGRSYKPDDVVRSMNGITIEVGNTDAEGRVTLADSLSWAVQKL